MAEKEPTLSFNKRKFRSESTREAHRKASSEGGKLGGKLGSKSLWGNMSKEERAEFLKARGEAIKLGLTNMSEENRARVRDGRRKGGYNAGKMGTRRGKRNINGKSVPDDRTEDPYNLLLSRQDGKCAICGRPESDFKYGLHIDHNHKTGEILGLLCITCNRALGLFENTQERFLAYFEYACTGVYWHNGDGWKSLSR